MRRRVLIIVTVLLAITVVFCSCDRLSGPDPPATVGSISWSSDLPGIVVTLSPTSTTVANQTYTAELYERGYLCATTTVSWTAGELNSAQIILASFPLTSPEHQEYQYLSSKSLAEVFSVKVHT